MTSPDNPNRDNATKSLEINSTLINRRNALRLGLTSVLTVALVPVNPILAAETKTTLPPVDPTNATAKALGYVEDATKTDVKKYKQYKAGQACGNCKLVQGKAGDARRPCQLFPGKSVAAKGWCAGWVKLA